MGLNRQSIEKKKFQRLQAEQSRQELLRDPNPVVIKEKEKAEDPRLRVVPLNTIDHEIEKAKKQRREYNKTENSPQLNALNDFFRYGVIPLDRYRELKSILLKSENEAEISRVMMEIRSYL